MTSMTDNELVRQQSFECDGPIDIDIELHSGTVEVVLDDADADGSDDSDGPDPADRPTDDRPTDNPLSDLVDAMADLDSAVADGIRSAGTATDSVRTDDATPDDRPDTDTAGDSGPDADGAADDGSDQVVDPVTADGNRPAIVVEVRAEPRSGDQWGLSGLLNWVGSQFGSGQFKGAQFKGAQFGPQQAAGSMNDLAEQALRETTITVRGNRLSVRGPKAPPLRSVPLSIVVHAPAGSSLDVDCGAADVRVGGDAGRVHIDSGSGDVSVDRAGGPVQVKTGSGDLRLGSMLDGVSARSGSGGIEVSTLTGNGAVHSGSGDVWLGSVLGDKVTVRTGSGDLTVADAASGLLQLTTGSGDLRIGIRPGVTAELDVTSGSGRTRSDLPVSDAPPTNSDTALYVRARTGSGEAVIGTATA